MTFLFISMGMSYLNGMWYKVPHQELLIDTKCHKLQYSLQSYVLVRLSAWTNSTIGNSFGKI